MKSFTESQFGYCPLIWMFHGRRGNKGWYTYDVHENCPIFKTPPTPVVHLHSKFFHFLTLDVYFQTNLPSLQMITNQFKENIIQGWLSYVIRFFLQVGFHLQYQLIIFLRVQLSKNITKCLLFIIIHIFSTHFAINLFY